MGKCLDTSSADFRRTAPCHPASRETTPDAPLHTDDPANTETQCPARRRYQTFPHSRPTPLDRPAFPVADESLCARPLSHPWPTDSPYRPAAESSNYSCPSALPVQSDESAADTRRQIPFRRYKASGQHNRETCHASWGPWCRTSETFRTTR